MENGIRLGSWFKALPKISPFLKNHLISAVTSNKSVQDDGNITPSLILQ